MCKGSYTDKLYEEYEEEARGKKGQVASFVYIGPMCTKWVTDAK